MQKYPRFPIGQSNFSKQNKASRLAEVFSRRCIHHLDTILETQLDRLQILN